MSHPELLISVFFNASVQRPGCTSDLTMLSSQSLKEKLRKDCPLELKRDLEGRDSGSFWIYTIYVFFGHVSLSDEPQRKH